LRGALTLFAKSAADHALFAEHIAASICGAKLPGHEAPPLYPRKGGGENGRAASKKGA
jgi:hypothetical protein